VADGCRGARDGGRVDARLRHGLAGEPPATLRL
jgi:hypothetical protein